MSIIYRISSIWRTVAKVYTKVGNTWRTVDALWVKQDGNWRLAAKRVPNVVGQAYDTAAVTLTGLGFTVTKSNTTSNDTTYQSFSGGYVASTTPQADDLVHPTQNIQLNTITYQAVGPSFGPSFGGFVPPPSFQFIEPYFDGSNPPPGPYFGVGPYVPPYFSPDANNPGPSFSGASPGYTPPPPPPVGPSFGPSFGNFYVPPPSFGPYFGPGGSVCMLGTTKVFTSNGPVKAAQDLTIADKLISIDVEEIDLDEDKINVHYWLSSTFTIKSIKETNITAIRSFKVHELMRINWVFYTPEHLILVKRNNEYEFVQAQFITTNDEVLEFKLTEEGAPVNRAPAFVPVEDTLRTFEKEAVTVYDISVEPYDVYFTENLLSHNK